jgi:6-phosphogluconolactonase
LIPRAELRPRERLRVVEDAEDLATSGASEVLEHAIEALAARGAFHLALAGGTTPIGVYRALATRLSDADAQSWHVWFGDERCVPPDHPASNYGMVRATGLLARLREPHVHRVRGEGADAADAAARYERELLATVGIPPRLDLVLLGLGRDGHTASLFPGTPALESHAWIAAGQAPEPPVRRITFTVPILRQARSIVMLVAGREKAAALARALDDRAIPSVPARRAYPLDGTLSWLVERSALGA